MLRFKIFLSGKARRYSLHFGNSIHWVHHWIESIPLLQTRLEVCVLLLLPCCFQTLHICMVQVVARISVDYFHVKKSGGSLIPESMDGYICPRLISHRCLSHSILLTLISLASLTSRWYPHSIPVPLTLYCPTVDFRFVVNAWWV